MDWRLNGVRVVCAAELDPNTPQTSGMSRAAAITAARGGAEKLWAGTVVIDPNAKTGAHHHGPVESVIYVVSGRARMRWGERLEFTAEAGPGDFIYVPPYVPHQEINANPREPLSCVLVRSGQEPVVVNLELAEVERDPQPVRWVDDLHGESAPELRTDRFDAVLGTVRGPPAGTRPPAPLGPLDLLRRVLAGFNQQSAHIEPGVAQTYLRQSAVEYFSRRQLLLGDAYCLLDPQGRRVGELREVATVEEPATVVATVRFHYGERHEPPRPLAELWRPER